jgi:hypothetical protein
MQAGGRLLSASHGAVSSLGLDLRPWRPEMGHWWSLNADLARLMTAGVLGLLVRRGVHQRRLIRWGGTGLLHAAAPAVGIAVWFASAVMLFLDGVWCGGCGVRRTSSPTPLAVEVWQLLRSLVGHGQR